MKFVLGAVAAVLIAGTAFVQAGRGTLLMEWLCHGMLPPGSILLA
jgi:hypothetical protein